MRGNSIQREKLEGQFNMIQRFIWQYLRRVNRIPGAYRLFYWLADLYLGDTKIVKIKRGPASGYRWYHQRGYQPWMAFGLYEPSVAQLIYQCLKPGDIFYDIGANAGYFTLVAAKAVGTSGKVIAFEPMTRSFNTVREQVALNSLEQICDVEKLAISNKESKAVLTIPTMNANAHLSEVIAPHINNELKVAAEEVTCTSLDNYITKHPNYKPTLIKIDIEGAEVLAIMGASELIASKDAPTFLITAHSVNLAHEVKVIFEKAGYRFSNFADMIHAIPKQLL